MKCNVWLDNINTYPAPILSWIYHLLFMSVAYMQVHFRLDFIMEENTMNPYQTTSKGAVWSRSIFFATSAT